MSYELRLSAEAERCIEDQLQWYESDQKSGGSELADKWLARLVEALDGLKLHPERHGFAPENGRWKAWISIRQMRFKPWKSASAWRILYTIDESAGLVTVLQIRHERRPPLG